MLTRLLVSLSVWMLTECTVLIDSAPLAQRFVEE